MDLQHSLSRFYKQQPGSPVFVLPDGEQVDLRIKGSRQFLTQWIIDLFDGDSEVANDVIQDIIPRALTRARAPWPYLVHSLYNISEVQRHTRASGDNIGKLICQKLGTARFTLFRRSVNNFSPDVVLVDGLSINIRSGSGRKDLITKLLGHDHYVLFNLLSPANEYRYCDSSLGLQRLVSDIFAVRVWSHDFDDEQPYVLAFIEEALKQCPFTNDFSECLHTIHTFHRKFFHPMHVLVKHQGTGFVSLREDKPRDTIKRIFAKCAETNQEFKAAWLAVALTCGIITSPLSWLIHYAVQGFDQADAWMDPDWMSVAATCETYGLKTVNTLFPELVRNDK